MSIEAPKIKNKPEQRQEKSEARKNLERKLRIMVAYGVMTLSTLGVLKMGREKGHKPEYKPKALIAEVEKGQLLSETEKAELQEKLDYLKSNFSEYIFPRLQESVEANKESEPRPAEVKGFEKIGLSNKDLQELWSEKYYPRGWLEDEIGGVEYRSEERRMGYVHNRETRYAGTHKQNMEGRSEIKFYAQNPKQYESMQSFIETLDWHFSHEAGHANDWEGESEMDFKKRVDFLYEVSQNCFREGAFRDALGYLDSIENRNKYKENYYKVGEYWGLCCEYYLLFPKVLRKTIPGNLRWLTGI